MQTVAKVGEGYTAPSRHKVGGPMLLEERDRVRYDIKKFSDPVSRFGSTVVSDGATDKYKRPVNNLLDCSPEVVEFVSSRDCTGKVKDKEFIANEVIDYILSLPNPFKIVQVLMDNATRGS
ncbi:hypothetical protein CYMTET_2890 [Cymbomonas tetramitiformis]|uniref:DUF659 domain-containing protein n=1 Tax=Cymbomonas tetramitiformis TaxID=36881 RepID=A0AAE0H469_9CHLO|nr:hypothetical protein CYMTET_2890 [Cymbomonas tetramitiformis]